MSDAIVLGGTVVIGTLFLIARCRTWRQPRMLLVWLAIASAAVGLGVLVALILGAVASISTAALWALLGAVVLFEGYRWMRRRRGSQLK